MAGAGPHIDQAAERNHRDGDNGGNEIAGDPIGETLDRRSSPLGFRDHGDDLGEHGLVADAVLHA